MSLPIATLALPRFLEAALAAAGYKHLDDLDGVDPESLAADLKIARGTAEDVLRQAEYRRAGPRRTVTQSAPPASQSAAALLRQQAIASPAPLGWSTGSTSIDRLLAPATASNNGGGVRQRMVVEVASPPGCGKTALLLRTAMSARKEVEVLMVDTEGGIPPKLHALDPGTLQGIHIIRITTQAEIIAFWHTLEDWLVAHPEVKLICIDTLSFFFRNPSLDHSTKKRLLEIVKQKIAKASTTYACAILIANQMATKLISADGKRVGVGGFDAQGDARAILMPQLGDAWVTPRTLRVSLFRAGQGQGKRYAHVQAQAGEKGERPWAAFDVDKNGLIVDVSVDETDAAQ